MLSRAQEHQLNSLTLEGLSISIACINLLVSVSKDQPIN